jgi:CHAT domain-containing protein
VRADTPLFGSLRFADGPLMIYDLERLENAPHTVVVAACDAGRPIVPVGDELLGLTVALLSQGTTQLIASAVPVLDAETAPFMLNLHQLMAAGRSAAEALAMAQQQFGSIGAAELATAASFLCFGAGFAAPVVQRS